MNPSSKVHSLLKRSSQACKIWLQPDGHAMVCFLFICLFVCFDAFHSKRENKGRGGEFYSCGHQAFQSLLYLFLFVNEQIGWAFSSHPGLPVRMKRAAYQDVAVFILRLSPSQMTSQNLLLRPAGRHGFPKA